MNYKMSLVLNQNPTNCVVYMENDVISAAGRAQQIEMSSTN